MARRVFIALLATAALLISGVGVSSAQGLAGGSGAPQESKKVRSCTTTLGEPDPLTRTAEIVSYECREYGSLAQMQAVETAGPSATASDFLLIMFYLNANWGIAANSVRGASPCDSYGYGISNMGRFYDYGTHGFTSYRLFNDCNAAILYMGTSYSSTSSGWLLGDIANVGNPYNDWWRSMRFKHI